MATRVGINGFGRIGRQVMKIIMDKYPNDLEVVAFNDLGDLKTMAHLYKYDSSYGISDDTVEVGDGTLRINGKEVKALAERDPALAHLYQMLGGFGEPDLARIAPRLWLTQHAPAEVRALQMPVLFVVGSRDPLFPPPLVRAAAALLADARVVEIEGSGHSPYFENAPAWNAAVAEFLDA